MSEKTEKPLNYRAYLLRLWQVNDAQEDWRASVESAHASERRSFADLEALFNFLRQQTSTRSALHAVTKRCAREQGACQKQEKEIEIRPVE